MTLVMEANETCKGDRSCLFDFIITGNQVIAENTKRIIDSSLQRQLISGMALNELSVLETANIRYGTA